MKIKEKNVVDVVELLKPLFRKELTLITDIQKKLKDFSPEKWNRIGIIISKLSELSWSEIDVVNENIITLKQNCQSEQSNFSSGKEMASMSSALKPSGSSLREILFIATKLKSLGHSEDDGCEKPIISRNGTVFVVKDCIDGNEELPCFKGIAFFNNKQIRLSDNVTNIPIYENTSKSCIVGNVGRKKESLGNEDFMYVLTFTPTKEAVLNLGIKTEQIFTIIEDFRKQFEIK